MIAERRKYSDGRSRVDPIILVEIEIDRSRARFGALLRQAVVRSFCQSNPRTKIPPTLSACPVFSIASSPPLLGLPQLVTAHQLTLVVVAAWTATKAITLNHARPRAGAAAA